MEKGSSSSSSSSGDPINGLKFGKKIYFEGVGSGLPPSSPAKKGRTGVAQGSQPPRCQVEGCKVDLSDAKAYYCRHKVCGAHSKSPKVIVAGLEQRFCQQCSRFHQLPEFDQGKRSCRRRLAGHNERRRKPPPGPLLSSRYGTLSQSSFDNQSKTGGFVMDFSGYSTSITGRDSWPGRGLANQVTIAQNNNNNNLLQGPTARPTIFSRPEISSEGCFDRVSNSNASALSLLSNESWGSRNQQALSLGVNDFLGPVQPNVDPSTTIGQFLPWGFKGNQVGDVMHEMAPDMGLAAISQPSNGQFSGDQLGLGQPSDGPYRNEIEPSRGYDSPVHHMHWSL
ncbi:squamosa promoter-binding-like protein 17 [Phtheirospermum japonicum]|uniref:Squamosa promoter-binding-like protein 17 n=1 Tax=Phtheirospermum japonicum TaxID=374723 RepID=A0A830B4A0_9LAMI|nr:squamosa promoter-binding-like protein 17 [Phtheirospermum japonicum]